MSRNLGIIVALMTFFTITYLTATEFISAKKCKGDVLLFQRNRIKLSTFDVESPFRPEATSTGQAPVLRLSAKFKAHLSKQNFYFQWKDICCDVKTKSGMKRILESVDGYVKPGTLTAVMVCAIFHSLLASSRDNSMSITHMTCIMITNS